MAERLRAPIVHALGGKEHIEWENPYDVGMTGLIGFSSGYEAMLACDTLLMLGTDFPWYDLGRTVELVMGLPLLSTGEKEQILGANAAGRLALHL